MCDIYIATCSCCCCFVLIYCDLWVVWKENLYIQPQIKCSFNLTWIFVQPKWGELTNLYNIVEFVIINDKHTLLIIILFFIFFLVFYLIRIYIELFTQTPSYNVRVHIFFIFVWTTRLSCIYNQNRIKVAIQPDKF